MAYLKRLIEVDLPIKRISVHARREKAIRHGHISTLHIWWARRPLAACRAVLCAALWPDPADDLCPIAFVEFAKKEMIKWSNNDHLKLLSKESIEHFIKTNQDNKYVNTKIYLRQLLLDFIADFANWDNGINEEFLQTARALTQTAHVALGGEVGTNPLVVDTFAGGGSIPLEALRVGADVFASDLNPIPVLINKVQLEYIPKLGKKLADDVRKWGQLIKEQAEKDLVQFYPSIENPSTELYTPHLEEYKKHDGKQWKLKQIAQETPIAFLWARTVICEGPNCGTEIPLIRSKWLAKRGSHKVAVQILAFPESKKIEFTITSQPNSKDAETGTVKRGSVTCPCCGFTTKIESVRRQLKARHGGANDARLYSIVTVLQTERVCDLATQIFEETGRFYRLPVESDLNAIKLAGEELQKRINEHLGELSLVPDEPLPCVNNYEQSSLGLRIQPYGIIKWGSLFNHRQLLTTNHIISLLAKIENCSDNLPLRLILAIAINTVNDHNTSVCTWRPTSLDVGHVFGRQAISMALDYAEVNPIKESTGSFEATIDKLSRVIERESVNKLGSNTTVIQNDASVQILPNDIADVFFSDPPYYDAIPYSDLSDFFYVWLRRMVGVNFSDIFNSPLTNKINECIVDINKGKDKDFFIQTMRQSLVVAKNIVKPTGIGIVVFAHKSTEGWEAQLQSMLESGWVFTASWPIDTESEGRLRAMGSAALASSVHLICRPRENADGTLIQNQIGDWRDVQEELPKRIHEWMPMLAEEGVAGADAIFACLGPALEIFSRYSKVLQAGSEREISLREYLEKVWAAISQEALNMVFTGGDAQGLEEDARLTAMWLWTLTAGVNDTGNSNDEDEVDDESSGNTKLTGGYTLEYDTARKIAQGLGANLEELKSLIEVKGDKARLLPVMERANKLFGATGIQHQPVKKKKKVQLSLEFENVEYEEDLKFEMPELKLEQTGKTVLDRLHQAMLLFSTGRTDALKRFLVEDGAGKDDRFWKLAQSLTSLYPKETDERRWVEAIQTYKKSLGF
jgi:adenine-specific DNA methylase